MNTETVENFVVDVVDSGSGALDRRCHAFSATVADVTSQPSVTHWYCVVGWADIWFSLVLTLLQRKRVVSESRFRFLNCLLSVIHWRALVKKSLFFVKETHGKSWSLWQCLFASLSLWLHCLLLSCRPARKGLISSQQWKESGIMLQAATTKSKAWS